MIATTQSQNKLPLPSLIKSVAFTLLLLVILAPLSAGSSSTNDCTSSDPTQRHDRMLELLVQIDNNIEGMMP